MGMDVKIPCDNCCHIPVCMRYEHICDLQRDLTHESCNPTMNNLKYNTGFSINILCDMFKEDPWNADN